MIVAIRSFISVVGLIALMSSAVVGADLFQWTDSTGIVHFTDHPYAIPESVRNSSGLVVRKDFTVKNDASPGAVEVDRTSLELVPEPDLGRDLERDTNETPPMLSAYAPQGVIIVVVNSKIRHFRKPPCSSTSDCKRSFRPRFNDRRHIQPAVSGGGFPGFFRP